MGHAGSARSQQEEATPQVYELEREGQTIRVALLGATYGTNCCIPETATGLFLTATVSKPPDEPARVTGMEWTPITNV